MACKFPIPLYVFFLILLTSCFLNDECDGLYKDQLFQFGEYKVQINSSNDTLSIGDSIRFRIVLPTNLYDSISLNEIKIEEIEVGFYVTRITEEELDTSLIYVFDQYFDINVNVGEMIDPYRFKLEEIDSEFNLDFYYICKQKLDYQIPIRFEKIIAENTNLECMLGDSDTWNAKVTIESRYNTFEDQISFPNYFGFVVE